MWSEDKSTYVDERLVHDVGHLELARPVDARQVGGAGEGVLHPCSDRDAHAPSLHFQLESTQFRHELESASEWISAGTSSPGSPRQTIPKENKENICTLCYCCAHLQLTEFL